jgi:hypothetical protein
MAKALQLLPRKQRFIEDAYLTDKSQGQQTKKCFF